MGYVKFTESIGDISKTYEFGSYEDFKDWENELSGVLISAEENVVDNTWTQNVGRKLDVSSDTYVEVMFRDKTTSVATVGELYWELNPLYPEDYDIVRYRKVIK